MGLKLQHIRRLDAFPRAEEHLTKKTSFGAAVSVVGLLTMALLFIHELRFFLQVYSVPEMSVDVKRGHKLPISINMTFPSLPCEVLSLDAVDMSGKHEVDLHTNIWKLRLHRDGYVLGSEFVSDLVEAELKRDHSPGGHMHEDGKEDHHIRDPDKLVKDIKRALEEGEGCQVFGVLQVERVAGNIHVSIHGMNIYVAAQVFETMSKVNVSHVIHDLSFGPKYPGIKNPLDGAVRILHEGSAAFKYFIKIVPTEYRYITGEVLATNQFSVSEFDTPLKPDSEWPAVYFVYDMSPITVTITEKRRNFVHFLTRLCAVLGGTFALTGMLDKWIYRLIEVFSNAIKERAAP